MNNAEKIFLDLSVFKTEGFDFGREWDKARELQQRFLLERPLILAVNSEYIWGPQRLLVNWTNEWWETEQAERMRDSNNVRAEAADIIIFLLTADLLRTNLLGPRFQELRRMMRDETVAQYLAHIGETEKDITALVEQKICINELRNPKEAFILVPDENIHEMGRRLDANYAVLKKQRNKVHPRSIKKDWWKQVVWIDYKGYVRELKPYRKLGAE